MRIPKSRGRCRCSAATSAIRSAYDGVPYSACRSHLLQPVDGPQRLPRHARPERECLRAQAAQLRAARPRAHVQAEDRADEDRSPGRMPIPHITRACDSAIRPQSPRPMPNAVGRPVVPEVPCTRDDLAIGHAQVIAERRVLDLRSPQLLLRHHRDMLEILQAADVVRADPGGTPTCAGKTARARPRIASRPGCARRTAASRSSGSMVSRYGNQYCWQVPGGNPRRRRGPRPSAPSKSWTPLRYQFPDTQRQRSPVPCPGQGSPGRPLP